MIQLILIAIFVVHFLYSIKSEVNSSESKKTQKSTLRVRFEAHDESKAYVCFSNLSINILDEIFEYIPKYDLIPMTLVNRNLSQIARNHLYRTIRVNWNEFQRIKVDKWIVLGIIDDSLLFLTINPIQFWKMLQIYQFDFHRIRSITIEVKYSKTFLMYIMKMLPLAKLKYKFSDNTTVADELFLEYVLHSCKPSRNLKSNSINLLILSELTISKLDIKVPNTIHLNKLYLQGNPMKILQNFSGVEGLKMLSLEFLDAPQDLLLESFPIDISKVKLLQIKFITSYVLRNRPNFTEEINYFLMKQLILPELQGLSIYSKDMLKSSNIYRNVIPAFNQYISLLPSSLKHLHLSIGCEIDFSYFENCVRNHSQLERIVWIGNVLGKGINRYDTIKFDMTLGVRLSSLNQHFNFNQRNISQLDLNDSTSRTILHTCSNNIFDDNNIININSNQLNSVEVGNVMSNFINIMCNLGKLRGSDYFHLDSFTSCKSMPSRELENMLRSGIITYFSKIFIDLPLQFPVLSYIIINGIHFKVLPSYDNNYFFMPLYDLTCRACPKTYFHAEAGK